MKYKNLINELNLPVVKQPVVKQTLAGPPAPSYKDIEKIKQESANQSNIIKELQKNLEDQTKNSDGTKQNFEKIVNDQQNKIGVLEKTLALLNSRIAQSQQQQSLSTRQNGTAVKLSPTQIKPQSVVKESINEMYVDVKNLPDWVKKILIKDGIRKAPEVKIGITHRIPGNWHDSDIQTLYFYKPIKKNPF
jgi:hypothetical protein